MSSPREAFFIPRKPQLKKQVDCVITHSKQNEFQLELKEHRSFDFSQQICQSDHFTLSITQINAEDKNNDINTIKVHIKLPTPSKAFKDQPEKDPLIEKIHQKFHQFLQTIDKDRLTSSDSDKILTQYNTFLRQNGLKNLIRSNKRQQSEGPSPGRNMCF